MSDLLRASILGTGQVPTADEQSGTAADELVTKLGAIERERALLLRAGAEAVLRRAGVRARTITEPIDRAPAEALPVAGPKLGPMLGTLLRGDHHVLPEALEGLACRRLRLPEELLPLALSEREPELRALLLPVLGERGRWLAGKRPEWNWGSAAALAGAESLPEDADERWALGTTAERQRLLLLARKTGPERARAWLEGTFKSDKPEQRVTWLRALQEGLSRADVPFLESALDDRSQSVRVAAARVLWTLPDSAVAQELRQRLEPLVRARAPEKGLWSKLKAVVSESALELAVELPAETYDKALERLGVVEAPPSQQVGRRQWWLAQHVAAVDPDWFCERLGAAPEALLHAAGNHDLGRALLNGWTSAALRFAARGWFALLWDAWLGSEERRTWFAEDPFEHLAPRMTLSELEPRLLRCLREQRSLHLLEHLPRPWPEPVVTAFLALARSGAGELVRVMPLAASRIPVELVPDALKLPDEHTFGPSYANAFEEFLATIDFRRRLAQELAS